MLSYISGLLGQKMAIFDDSDLGLPRRRGYFLTPHNWFIPDGLKDWSEGTTFSNNSLCWFKVKVATAARNQQFPKHPWFTSNLVAPSTMNWGSDTNSEARFHVTHGILPFKDVEFGRNSGSSNNSPDCWHLLKKYKRKCKFLNMTLQKTYKISPLG